MVIRSSSLTDRHKQTVGWQLEAVSPALITQEVFISHLASLLSNSFSLFLSLSHWGFPYLISLSLSFLCFSHWFSFSYFLSFVPICLSSFVISYHFSSLSFLFSSLLFTTFYTFILFYVLYLFFYSFVI